ncbi:MAG: hypothetical protein F9K35_07075 [Burkholderiaceae bacterium]|nr:MAG: hypothetical protein F9K35_07075 [Burkholderiaceae bacterium]
MTRHHLTHAFLSVALGLLALPSTRAQGLDAAAASGSDFHWNGSVGIVTDSRERGLSNSAGRPAARASIEWLHASGAFAELELLSISKHQYPQGLGMRMQAAGGYRWGDPDGWHYEAGGQYSRFPGSTLKGGSGYHLVLDPEGGDIIDATLIPAQTSPTTAELFGRISYQNLSVRYYHTVSRNFYGIGTNTVCPAIPDFEASFECFQGGARNTRGSGYLEWAYLHRLSKAASLELRLGYQRVRNFHDFNTRSFSLEYRHLWRDYEFSVAAVGARARSREVYEVDVGGGQQRNSARTRLVLGVSHRF